MLFQHFFHFLYEKKSPKWHFFILFHGKTPFWHFFHFLYEKNRQNSVFSYYFMKKCHFGIFFQFLYEKIAKTAFFYIISWENAASAFFPIPL
jgi:hypothetical protein